MTSAGLMEEMFYEMFKGVGGVRNIVILGRGNRRNRSPVLWMCSVCSGKRKEARWLEQRWLERGRGENKGAMGREEGVRQQEGTRVLRILDITQGELGSHWRDLSQKDWSDLRFNRVTLDSGGKETAREYKQRKTLDFSLNPVDEICANILDLSWNITKMKAYR